MTLDDTMPAPTQRPKLTRVELLRRVVILCESFSRNYAYYCAGWDSGAKRLLRPDHDFASFFRQANGNCLDMAVLEWCKLFTDYDGEHYWWNVVTEKAAFESAVLAHLGQTAAEHAQHRAAMWNYRSRFVAHLDDEKVMYIPSLDEAWPAVQFYHEHVVSKEGMPAKFFASLAGSPGDLAEGFAQCKTEAQRILDRF